MPTTINWPTTLPEAFSQVRFEGDSFPAKIESPTDEGPTRRRRRFTDTNQTFAGDMLIERTQYQAFEDFYRTETRQGTLTFNWIHPITEAAKEVAFLGDEPKWVTAGSEFRVSFRIEVIA